MIEFEKPNIECLEIDDVNNYAKFVCEPLERGYGVTIGNSLRRIMLSSLPGCAITSVKIDGVLHEFSTIPNVVEDVPELIVNLKNVRLKFDGNEEKTIRIDFKGEGEVTAGDIKSDGTVEVLNPDLHIATVSEGGILKMELTADMGRGYNNAEKNKKPDQAIGVLPIDSIYTPVKKVNYSVENTRVGQRVDYDKLTIEVWTDGSLKPYEALSLAAKVMTGHLELFIDLSETAKNTQVMIEKEENKKEEITPEELKEFAKRLSDKLNQTSDESKSKEEKQKDKKIRKETEEYRLFLMHYYDEMKKTINNYFKDIIRFDIKMYHVLVINPRFNAVEMKTVKSRKVNTISWGMMNDQNDGELAIISIISHTLRKELKDYETDYQEIVDGVVELAIGNELATRIKGKSYYLKGDNSLKFLKKQIYPYFLMYLGSNKDEMINYMARDNIIFDVDNYTFTRGLAASNLKEFISFCIENQKYILQIEELEII